MVWNEVQLIATLNEFRRFGSDNTLIECKRARGGVPEDLAVTICAFANMPQGGDILLGVDERAGFEIVGVPDAAALEKAVVSKTRNAVVPAPQLSFSRIAVDGKQVVAIEVAALAPSLKPARYRNRAYLRQSDGDYEMNPNDLRMLEVEALYSSERVNYDQAPVPGTNEAFLDEQLLREYLRTCRGNSARLAKESDESILRLTGVVEDSGELTIAGLYALGKYPQGKQPALSATAAVRLPNDGSGVRNRNLQHFDGPLPSLLGDIVEWVRRNSSTTNRYRPDGHMESVPEFPARAIREIVANALVHRDLGPDTLGSGKRVEIRLLDDRLIITSPGGLRGLGIDQLRSETLSKAAVNQRLYDIVTKVRADDGTAVIEGEGGGIREVFVAARTEDLPRPRFSDNGVSFTVVFLRGSAFSEDEAAWIHEQEAALGTPLSHIGKRLLLEARDGQSWTTERIVDEFSPISRVEAEQELRRFVELVAGDSAVPDKPRSEPPRADLADLGKNVPVVHSVLRHGTGTALKGIVEATGLSDGQVRYALKALIDHGEAEMIGGQGSQHTVYRLSR